jgi:hypothetical protein
MRRRLPGPLYLILSRAPRRALGQQFRRHFLGPGQIRLIQDIGHHAAPVAGNRVAKLGRHVEGNKGLDGILGHHHAPVIDLAQGEVGIRDALIGCLLVPLVGFRQIRRRALPLLQHEAHLVLGQGVAAFRQGHDHGERLGVVGAAIGMNRLVESVLIGHDRPGRGEQRGEGDENEGFPAHGAILW